MRTPRLAKLTRPRTEGLVARPRLFEHLDAACARPGVWIAGPPGAGKTSLVSSYLEARGRSCLWYQVDAGDADPATFFYYLGIAAAGTGGKKHKGLPLFTEEYTADLEGFARRFFRSLFGQWDNGGVLVLDNYQEVPEAAPFHVAVRVAAEELPEGVTLCAVSRAEPPAELARARASQQLSLIGWEHLKLTEAETAAIAGEAGADAATVAQLHEQSNGWAAGVVLMLERIRQTGGIRLAITHENLETIFQYFAGQVLHAAPRETQDLLLRMAQRPRLTAETAQVVMGNPEAPKLIEQARRETLRRWIEGLPIEQRRSDGWLMFWYGRAASKPARELKLSARERAFEIFEREADAAGQANAAVAMVDAIYSSPGDLRKLDRWISVLDVLLSLPAELQDDELRARMQSRFFRAVFTREPTSARTHEAGRRTRTVVDSDVSVATKYFAAAAIAVHNWILGYLNSTYDLISAMRAVPVTDALANDASVRLYRYFVEFQSQMRIVVPRDPLQALPPEREAESVIGPLNADLYRREAHELILGRRYAEAR